MVQQNRIEKFFSYPLTAIYYLLFAVILLVFHPIQWFLFTFFGYSAHKNCVDFMNLILEKSTLVLGTTYKMYKEFDIPENVPIIFVANHQSLYDIPSIFWYMRKHHPKFISKIELGKNLPSVSYNLRVGGSVLIDRKNPKQAIPEIKKIAAYIEKYNRSVVIFPEGTRSRTGIPIPFSETGLKILCKYAPSAYIVPITINDSYKMTKFGGIYPLGLGNRIEFTFHEPLEVKAYSFQELFNRTESSVVKSIKN